MAPRLVISFLGPPHIERDGVPVKLDRRKAVALLAYLAVTGQAHRRDALVNLLWPDYDATRGKAALRRTLYALRRALPGDWLAVDRGEVGLAPEADLWIDVDKFNQHLAACAAHGHPTTKACPDCLVPLSEAAGLVRGEFLGGFGLKDSINFDDWQLMQAEHLRRELAGVLERLVHWHSARREFEAALGYARRRLALDPLDEGAHRQLMRLYAWSGRRAAALRQYEECLAVLRQQLGVPPQESTTDLHCAIQEGRAPPPPDRGWEQETPSPSARPAKLPAFLERDRRVESPLFVARECELAELHQHLDASLAGQGKVVFITGEAGTGKTALIQEFARRAQAAHSDLVVAGGQGNAHTGVGDPYLPFREILGQLTGDVGAQWAAGAMTRDQALRLWMLLPLAAQALLTSGPDLIGLFVPGVPLLERCAAAWAGEPGESSEPLSPPWLGRLEGLVARQAAASGAPKQEQSALFEQVTQVLHSLAAKVPLLLALDDLQWADGGSAHLLFHLGRRMAGSRILIVGAYRPAELALGRPPASHAVTPGAGGMEGPRERDRHPLAPIVGELRRAFGDITIDLGRAESRGFVESLLDSEPNHLPSGFREMLFRQTRGNPLFTVELLRGLQERGDLFRDSTGAWMAGPRLDWDTLPARVEAVIAERIDRLPHHLRAALRVASVEGAVFTAEVVARVSGADEAVMLAGFSRDLDRRHRLIHAQSIQRLDGQLLSRYRFRHILFQRYLYAGLDEVERVHLHEQVGTALEELHGAGEGTAPAAGSAALEAIAPQLARHFREARIYAKAIYYLRRAGERAVHLSAGQEGIAALSQALALLPALPDLLERDRQELAIQLSLGMAWARTAGYPASQVESAFIRALELCLRMDRTPQLCRVVGELAIVYYVRAEYHRAREMAQEALSLARQHRDPLLVAVAEWYLGLILFGLGEYTAARAHLAKMIAFYDPARHHRLLVKLRGSDVGLSALAYDTLCLWCLGYPDQAASRSQQALTMARQLGHPFSLVDALCYAGCTFDQMRRDVPALENYAEELARLSREKNFQGWLGIATRFRGEARALAGQYQEGIAEMRQGVAASLSQGVRCHLLGSLCSLTQACARAGQPEEAQATLDEALSLLQETGERHWETELLRVRAGLLRMDGDASGAEGCLEKALELARRQGARSWELRASTDLARLWQSQGRSAEARELLSEIYGWFTEGFDTPDLKEARALLAELT